MTASMTEGDDQAGRAPASGGVRGPVEDPVIIEPVPGPATEPPGATRVAAPRLARHTFELSDGHRIGLAVCGKGVPLVVVHGFTAEGFLYAQTLNRLVRKGFKVVAIDMAGHGGTQGLPPNAAHLDDYARLMGRSLDELGIRKAVLAGHSMGGRVVAQLAARRPEKAVAVLLIDAIVGDQWDFMVNIFRVNPLLLSALGAGLALDSAVTIPWWQDPGQAIKLARLATPNYISHMLHPARLIGPAVSILRSRGSRKLLETLAVEEVPTFVIHGDRDVFVPFCTAESAAARSEGTLVRVRKATHSWLLRDPEALPAIVSELLQDELGAAIRRVITAGGAGSVDELEDLFYTDDAPILDLTPELSWTNLDDTHRAPHYEWKISA